MRNWLKYDAMGDLVVEEKDGRRRMIPPIGERHAIMEGMHKQIMHCSG